MLKDSGDTIWCFKMQEEASLRITPFTGDNDQHRAFQDLMGHTMFAEELTTFAVDIRLDIPSLDIFFCRSHQITRTIKIRTPYSPRHIDVSSHPSLTTIHTAYINCASAAALIHASPVSNLYIENYRFQKIVSHLSSIHLTLTRLSVVGRCLSSDAGPAFDLIIQHATQSEIPSHIRYLGSYVPRNSRMISATPSFPGH